MAFKPTDFYKDDAYLSNFAWGLKNEDFIAELILAKTKMKKDAGSIWTFDQTNLVDRHLTMQAGPGTKTPRGEFGKGTDKTYFIDPYKYAFPIPDNVMENYDSPLDPRKYAVQVLDEFHLLRKEMALATVFNDGTNFTHAATPGTTWDIYATSDPIGDIQTGMIQMKTNGLRPANAFACSWETWIQLMYHPDLRGQIGNDIKIRTITPQQFKDIFGLTYLNIGIASYRTITTAANTAVWGKHAWLYHYLPSPKPSFTSCLGFTMYRKGKRVDRWRETDPEQEVIRQRDDWQQNLLDETQLYMFEDCVA